MVSGLGLTPPPSCRGLSCDAEGLDRTRTFPKSCPRCDCVEPPFILSRGMTNGRSALCSSERKARASARRVAWKPVNLLGEAADCFGVGFVPTSVLWCILDLAPSSLPSCGTAHSTQAERTLHTRRSPRRRRTCAATGRRARTKMTARLYESVGDAVRGSLDYGRPPPSGVSGC